jgi:Domain of unknown function (DUF6471)
MSFTSREKEWANRARRYLKAELKRADVTYAELAKRLREQHGLDETEASITSKLGRGTFPATFFIAAMVAIGAEVVKLEDI